MNVAQRVPFSVNGAGKLANFQERLEKLVDEVGGVVVTNPKNIRLALLGLFAQGHVLLDDLPGVGKTLMAKTKFTARIQQLAITGDAFKFALYCYPQLQVRRPNACGFLKNLAV